MRYGLCFPLDDYVTALSCLFVTVTLLIDLEFIYWAPRSCIMAFILCIYRQITLLHVTGVVYRHRIQGKVIGCHSWSPSRTVPFLATLLLLGG